MAKLQGSQSGRFERRLSAKEDTGGVGPSNFSVMLSLKAVSTSLGVAGPGLPPTFIMLMADPMLCIRGVGRSESCAPS